jgi:uncharacterized membrane protein
LIKIGAVFALLGLVFAAFAVLSAGDRENPKRLGNAAFWGLVSVSFLFGDRLGDMANGALAVGLALIAGLGGLGRGQPATTSPAEREVLAQTLGDRLFIPALLMPLLLVIGLFALRPVADPKSITLIALAVAALIAVAAALALLRQPLISPLQEGRRLIDTVGWAALLPQMLAALGVVFALAGVGKVVGDLVSAWLPDASRLAAVCVYGLGMAGFTAIMGNAFAAFPVMTAAVGLPVLVKRFGGDPAVVCSIGMLCGFCGTLMTPLAANFNLVPPRLLELKDRYAVIKAQTPTAILLLIINLGLIHVLAFR